VTGSSDLDLGDYAGYLFRRAQQAHVATWQREVSAEISSVQFGVLNVLSRHPGASQRELERALDLDRSTIADLVQRLQRRGLIHRVRDEEDRRRNVLDLTELGRREFETLAPRVQVVDDILTGALSGQQRTELMSLLGIVLASTPGD
jgi:DNA-binding MarR family transcriptional regulator